MMFSKFLNHLRHLEGGGVRGHNPSEDGFLHNSQEVLSLNIGDTEQDTVRP